MAGEYIYEIRTGSPANEAVIEKIKRFMKRRGAQATIDRDDIAMPESMVPDFYDFCLDHLNPEQMTYRAWDREWKPLGRLPEDLGERWVDGIISQERVVSYAQPIVDADGTVIGHEALARFLSEDGTLMQPGDVFAAAKRRNRLYSLDRMCRMAAVRSAVHLPGMVFINFIPTSIYSPEHCLRSTIGLTRELGLDSSRFVFEVVETEQVGDVAHLKSILNYYTEQGFSYALDDVGEGFSTLELLRDIRPHYMKLDRGAVHGVSGDLEKQKIALQLLNAANQAGSVPLAEGVEYAEDFDWLKSRGYKLFQGYLWGKPKPVNQ